MEKEMRNKIVRSICAIWLWHSKSINKNEKFVFNAKYERYYNILHVTESRS